MPKDVRGYRLIVAAVFIILEIAAIELISKTSSLQNIWINRVTHRIMVTTWGFGDNVRNYFSLAKQNEELARENFELSREVEYYKSLYPEEVARAVTAPPRSDFEYIPARIIKISRNTQHNYIILNKGYLDGVLPHSGIITNSGVVGIIDAVDDHYSYGLTLMNDKVSVSSRVGKEGVVAPLVWNGISSNGGLLKNVPLHVEMMPGDTIRTSGISEVFPGDIPLGTVRDSYVVNGVMGEARVDLFQDFSSLRYVTVVCNPQKAEIAQLEAEEEKE